MDVNKTAKTQTPSGAFLGFPSAWQSSASNSTAKTRERPGFPMTTVWEKEPRVEVLDRVRVLDQQFNHFLAHALDGK